MSNAYRNRHETDITLIVQYPTNRTPSLKKGQKGRAKQELMIDWKYFRQVGQEEKTKGEVGS